MGRAHFGQRQSGAHSVGSFGAALGSRIATIGREQFLCQGQALFAEAVGEQAVVADAHEAFWQHVEEEATQELRCFQLHDALPAAVSIILPAEADPFPVEGDQAVVRDGDGSLLDVLMGNGKPQGHLPFELPSSMQAVEAQRSDVPHDSAKPLYPYGYALEP